MKHPVWSGQPYRYRGLAVPFKRNTHSDEPQPAKHPIPNVRVVAIANDFVNIFFLFSFFLSLFIISSQLQIHFITSDPLFLSIFRKMSVNLLLTNSDLRNEVYRICKKINSFVKRKKYR